MKKVSLAHLVINGWTVTSPIAKDAGFLGQQLSIIDVPYIIEQSLFGLVVLETSGFLENIVGQKKDKKSTWSLLKDS